MTAKTEFPPGDWIRENRQGAQPEQIREVRGNVVVTSRGRVYHVGKIVGTAQDAEA
jgi:hypothetical protein